MSLPYIGGQKARVGGTTITVVGMNADKTVYLVQADIPHAKTRWANPTEMGVLLNSKPATAEVVKHLATTAK